MRTATPTAAAPVAMRPLAPNATTATRPRPTPNNRHDRSVDIIRITRLDYWFRACQVNEWSPVVSAVAPPLAALSSCMVSVNW